MTNRHSCGSAAGLALVALVAVACSGSEAPPPARATLDGAALFQTRCASCHGIDGRGHGPAAEALTNAPADLTRIRSGEGWFPEPLIQMIIDGRYSAHGEQEMPVWGALLTNEELRAVTRHLRRIQE